jgi:hypothetical protein
MKSSFPKQIVLSGCFVALLGGYSAMADSELDNALQRSAQLKEPLIILVAESGQSHADDAALKLMDSPAIAAMTKQVVTVVLDLSVSRNRAVAARFHPVETPLLLCLSSEGVIISRDEKHISKSELLKRIEDARQHGAELDAKLDQLREDAAKGGDGTEARLRLSDFLLQHRNSFEAIPVLEGVVHSKTNSPPARVRAWVSLARAHLWVMEVEKARHEADDLIATLGQEDPEAIAGGNLIHGIQDANGKRAALAREEFRAAIAASPDSAYGKEAKEALVKLPKK